MDSRAAQNFSFSVERSNICHRKEPAPSPLDLFRDCGVVPAHASNSQGKIVLTSIQLITILLLTCVSYGLAGIGIFANDIEGGDCMNITTLDATLTTDERPLILKLDNEGSEVATLRGARRLLAERPPLVIILEWIPGYLQDATELVALLSDYDLFPLARHDSNVLSETYHVHDVLGEGLPLRDASGARGLVRGPEAQSAVRGDGVHVIPDGRRPGLCPA